MIRNYTNMSPIGRPAHNSRLRTAQHGRLAFASAALVLLLLAQACGGGGKEGRPDIILEGVTVGQGVTVTDPQDPDRKALRHEIVATLRIHNPNDFAIVTDTTGGRGLPYVSGTVANVAPFEDSSYDLRVEAAQTKVLQVVYQTTTTYIRGFEDDPRIEAYAQEVRETGWQINGYLMFRYPNKEQLVCVAIPGSRVSGGWPGECRDDPYVLEFLQSGN